MVLPGKRVIRGESLQPILSCARNCATPATLSSAQHNSEYLVDLINSLLDARLFSLIGPVVAELWAGPRSSTQRCAANWVSSDPKSSVVYTRLQRLSQVVRFSRQRSDLRLDNGACGGSPPNSRCGSFQRKRSAGTWNNSASFFACALLIARFPLTTSEAMPREPNTSSRSRWRRPCSSIRLRNRLSGVDPSRA